MSFSCINCGKNFSTKGNLVKHNNLTKKCSSKIEEKKYLYCEEQGCDYKTYSKKCLNNHKNKCEYFINNLIQSSNKLNEDNNCLQTKVEMLESQLKIERERVTNVTNNHNNITKTTTHNKQTISNTLSVDMRDNIFKQIMSPANELFDKIPHYIRENFNKNHLLGDKQSIYDFITNMVNEKLYYACMDKSGSNFLYKASDGSIKTDVQARILIDRIYDPLIEVVDKLADKEIRRLAENTAYADDENVVKQNTKSIKEIRTKTKSVKNIKNQDKDIRKTLADKLYYSSKYLNNYTEEPQKLLEDIPNFVEKTYLYDYVNTYNLDTVYSEQTEDDLEEIYSSVKDFVQFIIHNFLVSNCKLVYKYDSVSNKFHYNTTTDSKDEYENKCIKIEEDKCYLIHKIFITKTDYILSSPTYSLNIDRSVISSIKNLDVFTKYMKKYLIRYNALFNKV